MTFGRSSLIWMGLSSSFSSSSSSSFSCTCTGLFHLLLVQAGRIKKPVQVQDKEEDEVEDQEALGLLSPTGLRLYRNHRSRSWLPIGVPRRSSTLEDLPELSVVPA